MDPANPQSWNSYSYVNGDPLETTDPLGLAGCPKAEQDMNPGAPCPKSSETVSSPAKASNETDQPREGRLKQGLKGGGKVL